MVMKKSEFIENMIDLGADATFIYNDKESGLCSEVQNSIFSFQAWYGNEIKEYGTVSLETVMADPFFDGKSINDLLDKIDIYFV